MKYLTAYQAQKDGFWLEDRLVFRRDGRYIDTEDWVEWVKDGITPRLIIANEDFDLACEQVLVAAANLPDDVWRIPIDFPPH